MLQCTHLCAQYNLELPPTLYGEDLLNGNDLMTQSMDPSFLSSRLDNTDPGNHFLYFRSVLGIRMF